MLYTSEGGNQFFFFNSVCKRYIFNKGQSFVLCDITDQELVIKKNSETLLLLGGREL